MNASAGGDEPDKKPHDILPGVGEIVLWAAKDKRGYLIDINGSWWVNTLKPSWVTTRIYFLFAVRAKIDGQRWLRENMAVLHNTYKKASMAYRWALLNSYLISLTLSKCKPQNCLETNFAKKMKKRWNAAHCRPWQKLLNIRVQCITIWWTRPAPDFKYKAAESARSSSNNPNLIRYFEF